MNLNFRPLTFFRADTSRIILAAVLMAASVGANLLKPWPIALIIDVVLSNKAAPAWFGPFGEHPKPFIVGVLALALLAIHLIHGGLSAAQNFTAIQIGLRGLKRVRTELFAQLLRLSIRFHHNATAGDLIYRASWDTYAFQTLFQQGFVTLTSASLSLVLMLAVMLRVNAPLTAVALLTVPALLFVIKVLGRSMRERGTIAQQADSRVTSLVQQAIAAMPIIQGYTLERAELNRFRTRTAEAENARILQHGWELVYWFGITAVFAVATAAILWLGASQVLAGTLTVGELMVFLAYLAQLFEPLNQLSHVGATLASATAATQRVFEVLDAPLDVRDRVQARPLAGPGFDPTSNALQVSGHIEFRAVTFSYDSKSPVLRDVSFSVEAGESCAVIGPSGAGKSTLLSLVPRFFDPEDGAVLLDGVDLRDLRVNDLRRSVAVLLQEPILLPATIEENIACARLGATLREVEQAAREASAHDFIMRLPNGYATMVGEGAARLSVGERQRINIARAFLKNAPILLLDEPTSALDSETESHVVSTIFDLMRGRTTLIVAHRLGTIKRADKVLVVEGGAIREFGTPEELIERRGYYFNQTTK